MNGLGPTIGNPHPGYGLRVRLDSKAKDLAAADFWCPCGHAEDAVGHAEVEALVIRYGRHRRDACPNPEIRAAAARQYAALQHSMSKRKRK
ncbi:hypothetical protein [Streptomyces seoulensis]|uniref:hypothetical protein n=1 Tax=Streptomyces seoulensis TaxID=73044 RepID=UPI001FCC7DC4|nr:hypothetical protein [Streptomyces seoulensis]BDH04867.1 hypothetical protein HEK131_20940 [Streptomyces seoulensis]